MELSMVAIMLLPFLLIAEFSLSTSSQISIGSSLSSDSNNSWLSDSGEFAFGFYQQGNGSYSVGVWFAKTNPKTVVWTANRDSPQSPGDKTVSLNSNGRLVSQDERGAVTLISNNSQPAAYASMLDTGNFVLHDANSSILWQSFDSPTDTLLPKQRLVAGNTLVSAISQTNHSRGRFQLVMQTDGNLVQYPVISTQISSYHAYWHTHTYNAGNNVTLNLDPNGWLYLLNSTGYNIYNLTDEPKGGENVMFRLTLDSDGVLRLYSRGLVQNSNWSVQWAATNRCHPTGLCGFNAYCSLVDEKPNCLCLPGFDFIDQDQKDLGCRRNSSLGVCTRKIDDPSVSVMKFDGVRWENNTYSWVSSISEAECEEECLRDCNCEVALFMNQMCSKQTNPLRLSRVAEVGEETTTIVKVAKPTGRERGNGEDRMGVLISGVAMSSFGFIALVISFTLLYRFRMWRYAKIANQSHEEFLEEVTLRSYTFAELEKATNGFVDRVGSGAFGTVFKGVITSKNCRKVVTVKKLERVIEDGEREFRNEMKVIGKTHHRNLLKLLGYCHEGTNRLLVYEYMQNGSLADFLFKSDVKPVWEERIGTALNIARGILYLHEDCETQIIHCDIKPENILMDEKNCAKIADFGLSKLLMPDQTRTYTGLRGTRGYVAPEWHRNMPITVKADVYSFGIVLLEIVCGRRSVDMDVPEDEVVLANWVFDCFLDGELDKLVDDEGVEKEELMRMVKLGLWCIQEEPSLRPSMKKVCLMLEGTIEIPQPPNPTSSISVIQTD